MSTATSRSHARGPFTLRAKVSNICSGVSWPSIDGEAARTEAKSIHCLAKRRIGYAALGSELDEARGLEYLHEPKCERHMFEPGAEREVLGIPFDFGTDIQLVDKSRISGRRCWRSEGDDVHANRYEP